MTSARIGDGRYLSTVRTQGYQGVLVFEIYMPNSLPVCSVLYREGVNP